MNMTVVYFTFLIVASSSNSVKPMMDTLPPIIVDQHTDLRRTLFTANSIRSDEQHTELRKTLFTANSTRFDLLSIEDLPSVGAPPTGTKGRISLWSVDRDCVMLT